MERDLVVILHSQLNIIEGEITTNYDVNASINISKASVLRYSRSLDV